MSKSSKLDEFKPSRFRQQHSPFGDCEAIYRSVEQMPDAHGNIGVPYMVRDTIQVMRANGTLGEAAEKGARAFQADFGTAQLVGYQSPDLTRVLGSTSARRSEPARVLDARDRVWQALRHLGGWTTPVGLAAWYVVGLGWQIGEFAAWRQFGGRGIRKQTAQRLVVGACNELADFYRT